jgi:hypothetical protein
LASVEKELQQAKTDNTALAHYIIARRKITGGRMMPARRLRRMPARWRRVKTPRISGLKEVVLQEWSKDLYPPAS